MAETCDVAIIGGGPAGSTVGTLLKKYKPDLKVVILEREKFPREHVGESQLPGIGDILDEMGVWEKVEAANFPIKLGATYRWGTTKDLWDFDFLAREPFKEEPRPAKYRGQRRLLAWQVERSIYDKILLDHAAECGCDVREETRVVKVHRKGDRVEGLEMDGGSRLEARHYVDASGHGGVLRRAMDVEIDAPTALQNIAIWDYWNNAEWAIEVGVGGTKVQVMSLGYGWIWFIPIGPKRASVGLIVPAEYYKQSGKKPDELYHAALREDPRVSTLLKKAKADGELRTTKDWSFISKRMAGENWYLAGESAGFADPILAAGLTLAHAGSRELAYTLLALDEGQHEADWLVETWANAQTRRIMQHIRFADFWYSANGHFTELKDFTQQIAEEAGFKLSADEAFQWLGTGGFINDTLANASLAFFGFGATKHLTQLFTNTEASFEINKYNVFRLNLVNAEVRDRPNYADGKIEKVKVYVRDGRMLPSAGMFKIVMHLLQRDPRAETFLKNIRTYFEGGRDKNRVEEGIFNAMQTLEAMTVDGWISPKLEKKRPRLNVYVPKETDLIHFNEDPPVGDESVLA